MPATTSRTAISLTPPSRPRLRLQPDRCARTLLDGGWWPRSADPAAELPGLILALDGRHGPITRIMVGMAGWDPSRPRRLRVGGPAGRRVVRLGWFATMPAGLLIATCARGQRTDLLTVPPHTSEQAAWAAMDQAAQAGNRSHTPALLAAVTRPASPARPATGTAFCEHRAEHLGMGGRPAARPRGGARPLAAHGSGPGVTRARSRGRPEMLMTSAGAAALPAGSRPGAGLPAARTIVRLGGALDLAAAPALRERLIGVLHPGTRLLIIDLSRVPSCDPAGLAVLVGAQRRARLLGIVVRLVAPSLPVSKQLRLTGLDRKLTICPDLPAALAGERHEPATPAPSPQALAG